MKFIIIINNIIKILVRKLVNSLKVRDDKFGLENLGNLFWMMVKNIIMDKRIVMEKLIFLFDFKGKKKINNWMRFRKKIGSKMLYM